MDPPERKRKRLVNYNEGEFYRNAQKAAAGSKAPAGPRLAKMPQMQVLMYVCHRPPLGRRTLGYASVGMDLYQPHADAWDSPHCRTSSSSTRGG